MFIIIPVTPTVQRREARKLTHTLMLATTTQRWWPISAFASGCRSR